MFGCFRRKLARDQYKIVSLLNQKTFQIFFVTFKTLIMKNFKNILFKNSFLKIQKTFFMKANFALAMTIAVAAKELLIMKIKFLPSIILAALSLYVINSNAQNTKLGT